MLAVRGRHEAFAIGTFRELGGSNPSVLTYVREIEEDTVLCVNNLSRFPQPIELNLQNWNGYTPVEMTGYVEFPPGGGIGARRRKTVGRQVRSEQGPLVQQWCLQPRHFAGDAGFPVRERHSQQPQTPLTLEP